MMSEEIPVSLVLLDHYDRDFPIPSYQTVGSSGLDLAAQLGKNETRLIAPSETVPTGLVVQIPMGFEIQIRPRSGLSLKSTLFLPNSPGTIDSDYRGEIKVIVGNWGKNPVIIEHGQRIAQMVLVQVERMKIMLLDHVSDLSETMRGEGGFGHTGK